nr:MAG TPA: hypothetical protein [Caudoviricetes sp.]
MAIKPILFNTDMVRAILDGRKTCTRRVVKPQWEECPHCKYVHNEYIYDKLAGNVYCARCGYPLVPERKAPYQPGDILYVRETWYKRLEGYMYRADYSDTEKFYRNGKEIKMKWHPSIHMPKEAARIWLKVTDVRVERLQDITEDGAKAEGANWKNGKNVGWEEKMRRTAVERFAEIWESTIKKADKHIHGWNANPWVWVIEFERCENQEVV